MNESRSVKTPSHKLGMGPGSLIHLGDDLEDETRITVVNYSINHLVEKQINSVNEILQYKDSNSVTWIIIEGLKNVGIIDEIGKHFGIHQLVLEDILNTHQRPKFEEYEDHLFIVLKCLFTETTTFNVTYEQISLLVFNNFVFVFKEKRDDLFLPVLHRIRTSKGQFRKLGTDYLVYVILDTIVDQNFVLIDALDDEITMLEESLLSSEPRKEDLNMIQNLKKEIISIRRVISPIRELIASLLRCESKLISRKTHLYFRDVADHTIRIIESVESYRDLLTGLFDIYMTNINNKMNETMKVLTVFASIFIPLTFITGIYGMNFEYIPELQWKWAYLVVWIVFIVIPIVLLVYFRKKRWL